MTHNPPGDGPDVLLQHFGVAAPPVPVEGMCRSMGVPVDPIDGVRWSGAVNSSSSGAKIWVRSSDAPVRRRFTIAHELGHLMLHDLGVAYRDDSFSGGWKEVQANRFAAALLVPPWLLERQYSPSLRAKDLAERFEVSEQSMKIQVSRLRGIPAESVR